MECDNRYIYIGETIRLYRRFNEHTSGRGGVNTTRNHPEKLIGLYKVSDNTSFLNYKSEIKNNNYDFETIRHWGSDSISDNLMVENHITELYFYLRGRGISQDFYYDDGEWDKIRGGKYTKYMNKDINKNPTSFMNSEDILDRPCCDCGYPCEVKKAKDKNCIYFVCSLKNVWDDFYDSIEVDEPCDFYEIYKGDIYVKKQYEINQIRLKESWCDNLPTEFNSCIKCNIVQYNMLYSHGRRRQICFKCFSNYYEEIKKKYDNSNTCLIMDD